MISILSSFTLFQLGMHFSLCYVLPWFCIIFPGSVDKAQLVFGSYGRHDATGLPLWDLGVDLCEAFQQGVMGVMIAAGQDWQF